MRVVFFGTPEFAVPSLRVLLDSKHEVVSVVAQPDRPAGRGLRVQSPPVVQLARQAKVVTLQPEKIGDAAFLERIRSDQPDAGVVVAYGKVLPESLLKIPPRGFVNAHASLLPKYRGAAPIQRAIEQGETETGITIMRVDAELDHGPILGRQSVRIDPEERAPSLAQRLAETGARKLIEVLDALEQGTIREVEQDHARATLAPKINRLEGRVDWSASAIGIYNKFRAFDPWPGIFTALNGEMLKLTDVFPIDSTPRAKPGEIVAVTPDRIQVATGDGLLGIREVQRPGRRPVSAGELARAAKLAPGARFE